MAYDPADLRLPSWLLRLLNALISVRIPIGKSWRIGITRAGALMFFSLFGLWAAALYSGNNLLYLCGAMLTAISITAAWQGITLLRYSPHFGKYLPAFVEENTPIILRQGLPTARPVSALLHVTWSEAELHLHARLNSHQSSLIAQLHAGSRTYISLQNQCLKTSAPLGLWELEHQRHDPATWLVLPKPVAWLETQTFGSHHQKNITEGDEYHDMRPYMPGDAVTRIHWRKSTLEPSTWRIKRFVQPAQESHEVHLRVDLRIPQHQQQSKFKDSFEKLLGMAWYWLKSQPENSHAQLILGQQLFDLSQKTHFLNAIQAIAAAKPETQPPKNGVGMLLSLVDSQ